MIEVHHINAFSSSMLTGNLAAVCILSEMLEDKTLHSIAIENNLPITAFLLQENKKMYLRWFTLDGELTLCGHGTLATAWLLFQKHLDMQKMMFSKISGSIVACRAKGGVTI